MENDFVLDLLDLKNLQIEPGVPEIRQTIERVLNTEKGPDGGILPIGATRRSDVCVPWTIFKRPICPTTQEWPMRSNSCALNEKPTTGGPCKPNTPGKCILIWRNLGSQADGIRCGR